MPTLDLIVSLSAPPPDAPADALAAYTLRCEDFGAMKAEGVLHNPLDDELRFALHWYFEQYWLYPYDEFKTRAQAIEARLEALGRAFYTAIFNTVAAQQVVLPWKLQPNVSRRISLELNLSEAQLSGAAPVDPRLFAALNLPWELLHDGSGYLALSGVALVRRLPQHQTSGLIATFTPPLRVLLVTARPEGAGFVDPRGIARPLYDAVEERMAAGELSIEYLRPPTLPALAARLGDPQLPPVHILHFDGHGAFLEPERADPAAGLAADGVRLRTASGRGALAFEHADGSLHLVDAADLADALGHSSVKLAVLTACQSAVGAADDAFSSVAGRLIRSGVDAVIAMSASLLVATATMYVETFYRRLAGGLPATQAHEQARKQLHADPRRHPLQRRRDQAGEPVLLRDWWLPHFYQQRELNFTAEAAAQATALPAARRTLSGMPNGLRYGFGGRARELLELERALRQGKLTLIHGFGGQGKTSLTVEAADWLTRTGMYAGALFLPFEGGAGGASWLLAALGRHLGCADGAYNPNDHTAALARLRPLLRAQPTLLLLDNLETILPDGEAPLEPAALTALWDVALELRAAGAGLLLTSRDSELGDPRLLPGRNVRHLALHGLSPHDAYSLAGRLLDDLDIPRERAPYPELVQLLVQLDHHPLALELVLPVLADEPIERVIVEFSALLGRFMDAAVPGRNQSLLASLDYSLRRLSAEQRALLPLLAPFEGGASEDDLLAITEIPPEQWAGLRPALERAALIVPERIAGIGPPFLRFHPVLAPALRSRHGEDAALTASYAARYAALANWLVNEDNRNPQPVRALVQRELPNLRRALGLLEAQGDHEQVVALVDRIARFLNLFSLGRELAAVRAVQSRAAAQLAAGPTLSYGAYLHAGGQAEDAFNRGDLQSAYTGFSALLERILAQPYGAPCGPGSYEHCLILQQLARCLGVGGRPQAAEQLLREALTLIVVLIEAEPENQGRIRQRGALLTDLGNVLAKQGRYAEAQEGYEQGLEFIVNDPRNESAILIQLGTLALRQRDYVAATQRYQEALAIFQRLGEPAAEAGVWHGLGLAAQEQRAWAEAERCYRESLALREHHGDQAGAAQICNQLAIVAEGAGRPAEAEGWYRRALSFGTLPPAHEATMCNNLANLLANEIRAGRMDTARIAEARGYAERALAIKETLDLSAQPWTTLGILADLADLTGGAEAAAAYRRRERETFAAFAGNRYHIDQQHGPLIKAIAAAAQGDGQARAAVEEVLPQLEANGWRISAAVRQIWAGARDWPVLCVDLDGELALLILRVLEEAG